ncbi:MAG: hypothetical protein FJX20_14965 [Alphaproteobacteria bacterium]|nr:hypothetical protein [Alphaproteobacteria bacterium]
MLRTALVSIAIVGLALAGGPAWAAERWVGTSTGQDASAGTCVTVSFDLTIDGATIGGSATSPGRRQIHWTVSGRRDGQSINLETTHRENVDDARLQRIRWTGRIAGDRLELTQNGQSASCATPRTALLRRS